MRPIKRHPKSSVCFLTKTYLTLQLIRRFIRWVGNAILRSAIGPSSRGITA